MSDEAGLFEFESATIRSTGVRPDGAKRARNAFRQYSPPSDPMSTVRWRPTRPNPVVPGDLKAVAEFFEDAPQGRDRFRWTLRDSLDEALDGQRTGRWCYQHLRKTEKTYLGTAVEINLTREFDIEDGRDLDWRIRELEVDCKFSRDVGGWEIPMEMYVCADHGAQSAKRDQAALLVWMNDDTGEWAAGLLRTSDSRLRWRVKKETGELVRAYNRDNKRRLAEFAMDEIYWLWGGIQRDLPENLILRLSTATREKILREGSSGQERVNDLFRHVQNTLIDRNVVLTVGQQDDAPKRARDARHHLRAEGVVILGHERPHQQIAASLGLEPPRKGFWTSSRVTSVPAASARRRFFLDGSWWAPASGRDEIGSGPRFPKDWSELEVIGPKDSRTSRTDFDWAGD
ncbi:NaeI family type II restriction endonuclease [Gordonia sp. X0973]|uniref:NaeI family type II restriction endonuclease n=1 Tax=Gordonia sp. X0973 TaxID=2742602 RepID=UPI0026575409|nr:NaeI family type II restriction endonuclease [Gordonia sp. X0973]